MRNPALFIKNDDFNKLEKIKQNDSKINEIEQHIQNLTLKSYDITTTLENLKKEQKEAKLFNKDANNTNNEKIMNEISILKADNTIYREEINKLSEINNYIDEDLTRQRNRKYKKN